MGDVGLFAIPLVGSLRDPGVFRVGHNDLRWFLEWFRESFGIQSIDSVTHPRECARVEGLLEFHCAID